MGSGKENGLQPKWKQHAGRKKFAVGEEKPTYFPFLLKKQKLHKSIFNATEEKKQRTPKHTVNQNAAA